MGIHTNRESLQRALAANRNGNTIGFVPTMGALHRGHLALVTQALQENTNVVVSIFVNPTQFDNPADLDRYPRTLEEDITLLHNLHQDIHIFVPTVQELYQDGIASRHFNFDGLDTEMEGRHRAGHFDGVGTVVSLLLHLVQPDRAYFGEKDFQQLQIVRELVRQENLATQVIACPIVREAHGLALSSRNKRLTPKQFREASLLYETLLEVKGKFTEMPICQLQELVKERFLNTTALTLEYFEIADEATLVPTTHKQVNRNYRAFIAAYAGEIRLIDNMALN